MKPTWERDGCSLYCGDALEILPTLRKESIHAVITDPPFFAPASHYQSRVSWGRAWSDLSILGQFFFGLANEFKRVIANEGHLFAFCHDESYPVFYPAVYGLWDFTAGLVWDKTRPGLGKIFRHQFEMILWASNSGAFVQNDGRLHTDVLRYPATLSRDRVHPVEKPVDLMVELIEVCTKPGDVVLDCFMGSCSVGVACVKTGRRFIGVDLEKGYFEDACRAVDDAFDAEPLFPIERMSSVIDSEPLLAGLSA